MRRAALARIYLVPPKLQVSKALSPCNVYS